jgi:hypothetical protein
MTNARTVLVLLIVAAMAATSVTPTVAKPNTGSFNKSSEGFKNGKQTAAACKDLKGLYDQLMDKGTSKDSREAKEWKSSAKSFGCGWAQ